jgi:GT2 family glycosyltransferase
MNISVVLYNTPVDEISALIRKTAAIPRLQTLFLIDNSETPCLADPQNDKVKYLFNNKNIGFGAAHNIAIRISIAAKVDYHLIMNADVEFEPAIFDKLLHFMDTNEKTGLLMPKVVYPDGTTQYLCKLLPTPADLILRRFLSFTPWAKKRQKTYEMQRLDLSQTHFNIPSLSGCFMLCRTTVLRQTSGFDERFFMYMEDLDLCRRMYTLAQTVFYPDVSIVHHYGKGSYKKIKLLRYHMASAVKYFNKWGWFFDRKRKIINNRVSN